MNSAISRDKGRMAAAKQHYKATLKNLQIGLVRLQRHLIKNHLRLLVIFEGRDAAGKDGAIKRITAHLSPRETRVVALGKPSDRDKASWYFRRHVAHLPSSQEMVLMNRSWYNRAGVERVMGFCTEEEYQDFLHTVIPFEQMLLSSGHQLIKFYLDISKKEQAQRLYDRRNDPLKHWKISPIDEVAIKHWDDYTMARDDMLKRTNSDVAPWFIVRADGKKAARLNIIRHILSTVECPDKNEHIACPDTEIVFKFEDHHLADGRLAR